MRVKVAKVLSENLALRSSADMLFNIIEKAHDEEVIIDFQGVRSISRSFAHQYFLRKISSTKKIREENMPEVVLHMFKIVMEKRHPAKHELPLPNQPVRLEL